MEPYLILVRPPISSLVLPVIAACLLAFPVVWRYLLVPFQVRRKHSREIEPSWQQVELTRVDSDMAWTFQQTAVDLAALGFAVAGHVTRQPLSSGQCSVVSVWVNRPAGDSAQIIAVRTVSPVAAPSFVTVAAFYTEFTDGTAILTSNSATPDVFPPDPTADPVACPGAHDLPLLYRFHRARVDRDAGGRIATTDKALDAAAYFREGSERLFRRLTEQGYYVHNPETRRYEPTLKGAFLMTYRLLWPWKQINLSRGRRKADRLLRELGFGGLTESRMRQRLQQHPS